MREYILTEQPAAFSVDPMGSIYVVFDNGSMLKYDTTGTPVAIPGRKGKSSVWQIDASNPYKIIVFNRDMQVADIYSSQFAKINSIDFTLLETGDIAMLCSSYDNAFWTLTSSTVELVRFSEQLTVTSKTNAGLLMDVKMYSPTVLQESDDHVLLAQKKGPAYIFDQFGNLQLRFNEAADYWSLDGDVLYYVLNDTLQAYHTRLHEKAIVETELKDIRGIAVSAQWIAILVHKKILLFRKNN
ncbi:MAG: hypothetical protein A2W93_06250 [Bacteroidetes bacterium GWF2_43_63]|nr:MAG: hypothetical protein A2W94_08285 [Bacteroidetes bacterium GWE2_42_42]OFY53222.1 MAG: hypothetical protein A2W93_06250 [Bacteroidetes bacterium GWF2_43_63]HBG71786.1 hypothetical protein [Bacteroidales bacterium]HCB61549.1 hypothetical protein [Bacteroidales bacterium]HCY22761.1 hypothetical protein [Bacteroidales bacterium]